MSTQTQTQPTGGNAPPIPPEHMAAFKSAISDITREQLDLKISEFQAKLLSEGKVGPTIGDRKLRDQEFFDSYDPLKGKGIQLAQIIKVNLAATRTGKAITDVAREMQAAKKIDDFVAKALIESNFADGGSTLKPEFSSDWIELIRAALVFTELGIRKASMSGLELIFNRQDAPATATYRGELIAIIPSQQKTGQLKAQARELSALVPVSDNLLNDAGPQVDMMIRDDLVAVYALRAELAGLRGNGANDTPTGLLYACDQALNIIPATQAGAEATADEIAKDLAKLIRRVKGINGRVVKGGFVITPRVEEALETVSTTIPGVSSGVYPFREQLEKGLIRGFPYRTTTQIPENLGAGANETEVYFADFNEFYFVENGGLAVESFRGATFQGADGNPVYGVQQGVTVVRGTGRHDYLLRHKVKAAVLTGCKWGASLG